MSTNQVSNSNFSTDSNITEDNQLMGSVISEPLSAASASLSSDAFSVGFEGYANNTTYDYSAQASDAV